MTPLFIVKGIVQQGKKRGKDMGFPTANFPASLSTPQGTYLSETKYKGKIYPSLTFVGNAETFDEKDFNVETYILDFNENIYGKVLIVSILKKIRDNRKFLSREMLISQMRNDEKQAREFFAKPK